MSHKVEDHKMIKWQKKLKVIIMNWIFVDQIIEFMKLIDEIHSIFDLEHETLEFQFFSIFVKNFIIKI